MPDAHDVLAVRPETECLGWRFHRGSTSTISNGRMIQEGPWCECGKSWRDHTEAEHSKVLPAVSYESMATLLSRLIYLLANSEGDHAEDQSTRQGEVLEQFFATLTPYEAHLVRQHHANLSRAMDLAAGRDQPSSSSPSTSTPSSTPPIQSDSSSSSPSLTPTPPPAPTPTSTSPFPSDSSSAASTSTPSASPTPPSSPPPSPTPPPTINPSSSPPPSPSMSASASTPTPPSPSPSEGQEQDGSESPSEVPEPREPTPGASEASEGSTGPSEQIVTPPTPKSAPRKASRPTKKAAKR